MVGGKGWRYSKRTPWLVWQLGGAVSSKLRISLVLPVIGQSYHQVLKWLQNWIHQVFQYAWLVFKYVIFFKPNLVFACERWKPVCVFLSCQVAPYSLIIDFRKPILLSRIVTPSYPFQVLDELAHSRFAQISLTMMWPQQCLVTDVWNVQYPANFKVSARIFVCWLQSKSEV